MGNEIHGIPEKDFEDALNLFFGNGEEEGFHPSKALGGRARVLAKFTESGPRIMQMIDSIFDGAHALPGIWKDDLQSAGSRIERFIISEYPSLSRALQNKVVGYCTYQMK
jgi:hypothetical protein